MSESQSSETAQSCPDSSRASPGRTLTTEPRLRISQGKGSLVVDVRLIHYLSNLSKGRLILWCYFIWYLVVLVRYFDPSPRLWLVSLGLSLTMRFALFVSTTAAGETRMKLERCRISRRFIM